MQFIKTRLPPFRSDARVPVRDGLVPAMEVLLQVPAAALLGRRSKTNEYVYLLGRAGRGWLGKGYLKVP